MRFWPYLLVAVTTIVVYVWAAIYEIERLASVESGLIRAAFDLLFLVPLELLAFSLVANALGHPSREIFGRMFKGITLSALGFAALLAVGFVVFFLHALGGLPGVAH